MSNASPQLADHTTPFIANEWYVAALSSEVTGVPLARTFLSRGVMLFRKRDGSVAALRDRCPHRSFPLSKGRVEGDRIVCRYHGLEFAADGTCTSVPSQDRVPNGLAVRSYPIIERAPFIWIWMGEPELADADTIPEHHWLSDSDYAAGGGYMFCRSSYVRLHENVLDLTHFPYVHGAHIGGDDYVGVPAEIAVRSGSVSITRKLENRPVPGIFSMMIGNEGHQVNRISESWFVSPAFHISHATIEDLDGGVGGKTRFHNKIVHCFTPATAHTCHYFFQIARDMRIEDDALTAAVVEKSRLTFVEDEEAVERIESIWIEEDSSDYQEMSILGDRAGLRMRSIIARRAEAEARGSVPQSLLPVRSTELAA